MPMFKNEALDFGVIGWVRVCYGSQLTRRRIHEKVYSQLQPGSSGRTRRTDISCHILKLSWNTCRGSREAGKGVMSLGTSDTGRQKHKKENWGKEQKGRSY